MRRLPPEIAALGGAAIVWITFAVIAGLFLAVAMAFILVPLTRLRSARRPALRPTHDGVNVCVHRDQIRELERDLADGSITRTRYDEAVRDIERRLIDANFASYSVRAGPGSIKAMPVDYAAVAKAMPRAVESAVKILDSRNPSGK